jgi:hypothetical protein
MTMIPRTKDSLVLRTDFSDDAAWTSICEAVCQPVGDYRAYVDCVSDPQFNGLTPEQLATLVPMDYDRTFVFLVDREALTHPEHPVQVVDVYDEPGRTFRVIPSEMWGVENNLSISNMDWEDFALEADDDGIFRGFPRD